MSSVPQEIFLRNSTGEVQGPLDVAQLQQLVQKGLVVAPFELSVNGSSFAPPGSYPELRSVFPTAAAVPASGVPMAGPGARAKATEAGYKGPFDEESVRTRPATGSSGAAAAEMASPLEGIHAPPAQGELGKLSPMQLYYLAAASDSTGRLNLVLPDRTLELWFKKGNLEAVGSSHPEDSVAAFLRAQELVTADGLAKAEAEKVRFGGELVGTLFALGLLNPGSGFTALSQHAGGILQKALLATQGRFTFVAIELPAQRAMPLGNRWSVLVEAVRRLPVGELRRRLEPVLDLPVMKSGGRVPVSELRLSPKETRAFGYIDGVRSLHHLLHDLPQEQEHLIRVVFLGKEVEAVTFAAVKLPPPSGPRPEATAAPMAGPGAAVATNRSAAPAAAAAPVAGPGPTASAPASAATASGAAPTAAGGAARAPAAPAAAPARPGNPAPVSSGASAAGARPGPPVASSSPPVRPGTPPARPPPVLTQNAPKPAAAPSTAPAPLTPAQLTAEIQELRAMAAKLREQNLFEVLGLSQEKTDSSAVKIAYFKLAKQYHPDTVTAGSPPELSQLKAEIFARVGEAYRTLGDDKSRAEYIDNLKYGGGDGVDIAQLLQAEETFQRATLLVKARKYQNALELLEEAIGINKDEGEFYAWRGYARFMAAADKKAVQSEAERDLQAALMKNPRCAPAHYFQGQVYKALGDTRRALESFKKSVEISPDHIDAQREIRLLTKK